MLSPSFDQWGIFAPQLTAQLTQAFYGGLSLHGDYRGLIELVEMVVSAGWVMFNEMHMGKASVRIWADWIEIRRIGY